MFDRHEFAQELLLREHVRKAIKIVVDKRKTENQKIIEEEIKLRGVIRKLITEGAASGGTPETPHRSTGINVLEDLLELVVYFAYIVDQFYHEMFYLLHPMQQLNNLVSFLQ